MITIGVAAIFFAYVVYPWLCRCSATRVEAEERLPGDDLVPRAIAGYTLAKTIAAPPSAVWPWLVQIGQGRGGFYTHERIENLLRADIHNAKRIHPELQTLRVGDRIRLTPDPYLGRPGQALDVAEIDPERALVLVQTLPNGSRGTWTFVLRPAGEREASTRLVMRRRGARPSLFDRVMGPGYYFMDRGMLSGLAQSASRLASSTTKRGAPAWKGAA